MKQENRERGEILGLAVGAGRDLRGCVAFAVLFWVIAADLLTHNPSGRDRVYCDPVFADLARQPFGPGVDRGLGGKRGVEPVRFRLACNIDDAAPAALDHLRKQRMGDLTLPGEIERDRLFLTLLRSIHRQRATAPSAVDQNVDTAEPCQGGVA